MSPTAETVEGALPTEPTQTVNTSKGDPAAGKEVFASAGCAGCHTFKAAGSSATIGPDLDTALQGKDASFVLESIVDPNKEIASGFQPNIMPTHVRRVALRRAARRPRRLPDAAVELTLPAGFPRDVEVLACDLDRTLIAKDGMLPPRTEAAIRAARAAGIRVVIATGRMFVSVRPYVLQAGIDDPVVCYQGAVVAEPQSGRWLRHEPIPVALAKEAIEAIVGEGFHCNVYVDDELFVGKVTPEARAYADFQGLVIHEVGDLAAWLEKPATKVVSVGEPELLDGLEARLKERFAGRLYISKSLPFFLEIASPKVTKGSGLQFLADHIGFSPERTVAFGDGENDIELLEWAGFGIAVANAHERLIGIADYVCPLQSPSRGSRPRA